MIMFTLIVRNSLGLDYKDIPHSCSASSWILGDWIFLNKDVKLKILFIFLTFFFLDILNIRSPPDLLSLYLSKVHHAVRSL